MTEPQRGSIAEVFQALPLPRGRAYLSLTFAGLALLFLGGVLSYASGSPDVHGRVSSYWTAFFALYAVAFGGAALLGAFPRLDSLVVKAGWVTALGLLFAAAMALRWTNAEPPLDGRLWSIARWYGPALLPVTCGLWWKKLSAGAEV